MPTLATGKDPNIVYFVSVRMPNYHECVIFKRYDVITGKTFDIATINDERIVDAQVSTDGQWVLFTANIDESSDFKVQIMRMDGQYLQTLNGYVEAVEDFQWSPDQKSIMLYRQGLGTPDFDQLNLATGQKETELVEQSPTFYQPRTWLNTKRMYVVNSFRLTNLLAPQYLYMLDTSKGPNQHTSALRFVTQLAMPYAWDIDSSPDSSKLFISRCHCSADTQIGKFLYEGPSSISVMPTLGGEQHTIYRSSTLAVRNIRAIGNNTLLLLIANTSGDTSQNGLWIMNADGSGLTRLTTEGTGETSLFTLDFDSPHRWSNVSRDGGMYALDILKGHGVSLLIGSANGGPPITIASLPDSTGLAIAGWTTM